MKRRIIVVISILLTILSLGFGYAILITQYGIGLRCPIRLQTGISCPFCGLTRMCLALLRFVFVNQDFNELSYAYNMNPFVVYISPFVVYLLGSHTIFWIKNGKFKGIEKTDKVIIVLLIIVMLIWWVFRNIF